jgi:hypothetical protein
MHYLCFTGKINPVLIMHIDEKKNLSFIKIIEVMLTCSITKKMRQWNPPGDTEISAQLSLNSTGL